MLETLLDTYVGYIMYIHVYVRTYVHVHAFEARGIVSVYVVANGSVVVCIHVCIYVLY